MIYNIQPSLSGNPIEMFNYLNQDIISKVFDENINKAKEFKGFSVIEFEDNFQIFKITSEDFNLRESFKEINQTYLQPLMQAENNNGVYANIRGFMLSGYASKLAKYSTFDKSTIVKNYKNNIAKLKSDEKDKLENGIKKFVPIIREFATATNQIKESTDANLKGYNDLDFYAYWHKDYLFVACYASATMYAIKFNGDDYVVYGEKNDYGKIIEELVNPDFCWDSEPDFERLYLKYLSDAYIVFKMKNGTPKLLNSMGDRLYCILEYILEEEKLISE